MKLLSEVIHLLPHNFKMAYSQKHCEERETCTLFVGVQTDAVLTETNADAPCTTTLGLYGSALPLLHRHPKEVKLEAKKVAQ